MLVRILIGLAAVAVGFVVVVALRPSEYRVARTATIAAPAPAVLAQVNDFQRWGAWNPWAKIEIGGNFEKGLADMKAVVEAAAHVDSGPRRSIQ